MQIVTPHVCIGDYNVDNVGCLHGLYLLSRTHDWINNVLIVELSWVCVLEALKISVSSQAMCL